MTPFFGYRCPIFDRIGKLSPVFSHPRPSHFVAFKFQLRTSIALLDLLPSFRWFRCGSSGRAGGGVDVDVSMSRALGPVGFRGGKRQTGTVVGLRARCVALLIPICPQRTALLLFLPLYVLGF